MKFYVSFSCRRHAYISKKILRVMRLTFIIVFAALMQVYGISKAQNVTLSEKNVSLDKIFKEIKKQTGFKFLYNPETLEQAKPVTITVSNKPLNEVLQQCFANQPLAYTIYQNDIVVREKEPVAIGTASVILKDSLMKISGKVVNENNEPLAGVTIRVNDTVSGTVTNEKGLFTISVRGRRPVLTFSYIGYKLIDVVVSSNSKPLIIRFEPDVAKLQDVTVVSTGYQTEAKERLTGSFEKIDSALFNRTTGTDIIPRLEGVASGLFFDKRNSGIPNLADLSIRGLSTLTGTMTSPLIVLDNFPYDGDINNINPNDVESITILKDAAAASIWGARAGNGVIVITTKKGNYNRPAQVSLNSNVTVSGKPNLFYLPQMSSADYIGVEKMLFGQGYYDAKLSDNTDYPYLSPVVELLAQGRAGTITPDAANSQINTLSQYDARNDYLKYVYRDAVNQQYALNISGGSDVLNYLVSGGYDKDLQNMISTGDDRITLRSNLSFKPVKKLEIQVGTFFTQSGTYAPGQNSPSLAYNLGVLPYTRLADNSGNPLVVGRDYSSAYAANPGNSQLLNWQYVPLQDVNESSSTTKVNSLLLNIGATYKFNSIFSADVKYEYGKTLSETQGYYSENSYYARNLINEFTQPAGSPVILPIPLGGILNESNGDASTYTARGQINANKSWGSNHLTAMAGVEIRQDDDADNTFTTYGYDPNTLSYQSVDFNTYYTTLPSGSASTIPTALQFDHTTYRYTSLFANAAYTYLDRYTLYGSARKDASNLYGVATNLRGVPLWSSGVAWNISKEPFYNSSLFPYLKLRASYGYGGNTNNSLSALSIIKYNSTAPYTNLPAATINNPANDKLRWEKVGTLNLGLDFGFKNNRITGTLEYYDKRSTDVLVNDALGYTTGFSATILNAASMYSKGFDLNLHSKNLTGDLKWNTDVLLSHNVGEVTKYSPINATTAATYLVQADIGITPLQGSPVYSVYSYKSAGLDPQTGSPRGYLNGQVSEDYNALTNVSISDLKYNGSALPLYYGSIINTFAWKNFGVSANIIYKLDYYFRKPSINYTTLFSGGNGNSDFDQRWQKPGDELTTNVPSMIYPDPNPNRDLFYQYSSALVYRADNIRLQDITFSYMLPGTKGYFKNIKLYGNVTNLGILWRANKFGIDPDYGEDGNIPPSKTFSLGLNANF